MKSIAHLCLFFMFGHQLFAQKTGIIKYQMVSSASEDTLKNLEVRQYQLVYKNKEVSFIDQKKLQRKITSDDIVTPENTVQQPPEVMQYQDFDKKILLSRDWVITGGNYLVQDEMKPIIWRMFNKSKKIQNIECFSAQAEYRGRVWTAWYAPSIPISSGPWKLYGLPGMILEAEDARRCVRFECVGITIPAEVVIVKPQVEKKERNEKPIDSVELGKTYETKLTNFIKMLSEESGGKGQIGVMISNLEIFAFEKDMHAKRFQQKLSDIPKK